MGQSIAMSDGALTPFPHDPLVVIASFRSSAEERVAVAALEGEGIATRAGADAVLGEGWRCLAVGASEADRALGVLRALWPSAEAPPAASESETCPACGSKNVRRVPRLLLFVLASAVLLTAGAITGERGLFGLTLAIVTVLLLVLPNRGCPACGERWRAARSFVQEERAVETPDVVCLRCGSFETETIDRRRLRAITLLVNLALPPLVVLFPFLPRRRCDDCGHEWR